MTGVANPTLNQIAFSVTDLRRTHQWYIDVFGFATAGGTEMFKGWITAKVQGVPGAATTCWWLIDSQDYFQLELFQFHHPRARPLPADWTPADIGYSTIGIHVRDFDATLARAAASGTPPLTAPLGEVGQRRVCVRDPEGVLVEILEEDIRAPAPRARPRPELPATVRFVTASVPDLDLARSFWVDGLGLPEARDLELHTAAHEQLWGLPGAERRSLLLWANDLPVELVQYTDPPGRPWPPNYYISDQGLLNVAFGFRTRRELNRALRAAEAAGATPNWTVLEMGSWGVVYVNDVQGFSVELLYVRPWWDRQMGFLPAAPDLLVERSLAIGAPPGRVWERLVDHERMSDWWPCRSTRLAREGEERNGPGAVREIAGTGMTLVEEVVAWEPGRRLDYRLRSGAPLRYHFGRVRLAPREDGGTDLHYTIRFTSAIPLGGRLLRRLIAGMLDKGLGRLKALAEREGNSPEGTQA
jgi:catechol 2,3-dioxygenase-like lactoylglutathione lyase family enzyme/uncharacterized protein YndB with AHSA1/START domain